jgi:hypothetical protein
LAATGRFDEQLGVGADTPWGAGKMQNIPLKALALECRKYYDPAPVAQHSEIVMTRVAGDWRRRVPAYARVTGFILTKHRYSLSSVLVWSARSPGFVNKSENENNVRAFPVKDTAMKAIQSGDLVLYEKFISSGRTVVYRVGYELGRGHTHLAQDWHVHFFLFVRHWMRASHLLCFRFKPSKIRPQPCEPCSCSISPT